METKKQVNCSVGLWLVGICFWELFWNCCLLVIDRGISFFRLLRGMNSIEKFKFWKVKGLKNIDFCFISKRYNERSIGYNGKNATTFFQIYCHNSILYNKYFYSKTKISWLLLGLRKHVFCLWWYVCKTDTTHAGVTSS